MNKRNRTNNLGMWQYDSAYLRLSYGVISTNYCRTLSLEPLAGTFLGSRFGLLGKKFGLNVGQASP